MPKLKKPDDFIIEDEETREWLTALLGRWGDEEARLLVTRLQDCLMRLVGSGELQLEMNYSRFSYNSVTKRRKTEKPGDWAAARSRILFGGVEHLQSNIGQTVKTALITSLELVVVNASRARIDELEMRMKAAETRRTREYIRRGREAGGVAKPFGRPEEYTKGHVEQRSIAIIRALGIKNGERV